MNDQLTLIQLLASTLLASRQLRALAPPLPPRCSYGTSTAGPLGPYAFRGSLMWNPPFDCSSDNCTSMGENGHLGDNNHQGLFEFPAGSGRHWLAYHTRKLARERAEYLGCCQRNVALDRLYLLGDAGTRPLPAGLPWVAPAAATSPAGLVPVSATPAWLRQVHMMMGGSLGDARVAAASRLPGRDCLHGPCRSPYDASTLLPPPPSSSPLRRPSTSTPTRSSLR